MIEWLLGNVKMRHTALRVPCSTLDRIWRLFYGWRNERINFVFCVGFIGNFQRRGTSRRLAGLLPVGILPALDLPVPSGFTFLFCLSCSTRVDRSRRLLVSSLLPPLSPFLSSPLLPLFDLPPPPVRPPVGWVAYRHLDIEWHFRSKQTS